MGKIYMESELQEFWNSLHDEGYMSVVFVRHPLERLASAYRDKLDKKIKSESFEGICKRIVYKYKSHKTYQCTFKKFVNVLLQGSIGNHHWNPISEFIYPCDLNYTVIGKLETFSHDMEYIVSRLNVTNLDVSVRRNKILSDDREKLKEYYSTITKKQLLRLYKKYMADFQLFGYDYKEYLKYVMK